MLLPSASLLLSLLSHLHLSHSHPTCPTQNMTHPTTPLEPTTQAFVDAGASNPPIYTLPIPAARAFLEDAQASTNPPLTNIIHTPLTIPVGPTGNVNVHIYKPNSHNNSTGLLPTIVYLHGGGWILGSPITHQRLVQDLIAETSYAVFFIYYTPSPEAVYPVPIEQSYAAVQWLHEHGPEYGLDPLKTALIGDSAGGAISSAVNLLSLQRKTPLPLYNILFYPVADISHESRTYELFANGPGLLPATLRWMVSAWAPDVSRRSEILASPLLATQSDLEGFPKTLVIVAEVDPLREEGEQFARNLAKAGVETTVFRAEGTVHDFVMLNGLAKTPAARMAIEMAGVKLRGALA